MNAEKDKLAFVDIGNSRFKFYYNNSLDFYFYSDAWQTAFKLYLETLTNPFDSVLISSVNDEIKNKIIKVLNDFHINIFDSKTLFEKQSTIDFSEISGMGDDRKLGLFGALNYYKPPFITIDCGTAVTINVLNKNYKCLGGVIFADIYTQIKGLSEHTDGLDLVDLFFENQSLAKNTEQALRIGIVKSVVYGIKGITDEVIKNKLDKKGIPIILTGGSAKIIGAGLKDWQYDFQIKENLVLEGLYFLYKLLNNAGLS